MEVCVDRRPRTVRAPSGDSGMTLLEVLIASGVMAIALVFTIGSILSVSSTTGLSEDQAIATATISSVLEELRSMTFDEVLAYQPAPPARSGMILAGMMVDCFDASGAPLALPVDVSTLGAPLPNPLEVRVTVAWRDEFGRPFVMSSTAYFGQ